MSQYTTVAVVTAIPAYEDPDQWEVVLTNSTSGRMVVVATLDELLSTTDVVGIATTWANEQGFDVEKLDAETIRLTETIRL